MGTKKKTDDRQVLRVTLQPGPHPQLKLIANASFHSAQRTTDGRLNHRSFGVCVCMADT